MQKIAVRFSDIYKESIAAVRSPYNDIDRGRKVLESESECATYLALFGGHHFHEDNTGV